MSPEGPPAGERLVHAAWTVMLDRGYSATTVDEICAMANASKGSFYHLFESKEDLALAVLDRYYETTVSRLFQGDWRTVADPVKRVSAFLEHTTDASEDLWTGGCLLGSFALDLATSDERARAAVSRMFGVLTHELAGLFAEALAAKGRADPARAEMLAQHLLAVIEGSIILAKANSDPSRIPAGVRDFARYAEFVLA